MGLLSAFFRINSHRESISSLFGGIVILIIILFILGFAIPIGSPVQKATPVATDGGVFAGRLIMLPPDEYSKTSPTGRPPGPIDPD